jgi:hypothetical protein
LGQNNISLLKLIETNDILFDYVHSKFEKWLELILDGLLDLSDLNTI